MWTRHAPAGRLVNVTRIAWGVFFLGSAVFNALITAPNAEQVYLSFAGMSWPVAEQLVRHLVVPVGMAFTLLVVAFEITVGLLILRRRTPPGSESGFPGVAGRADPVPGWLRPGQHCADRRAGSAAALRLRQHQPRTHRGSAEEVER
jgi:hypothetical protein